MCVGQLLHQRDSIEDDLGSPIDDAVDINSTITNDNIDDPTRATPVVDEATFLTDAMYDLHFIVP